MFLQQNVIKTISGLENNISLVALNLSNNLISKVEGLTNLIALENLSLGNNQLEEFESLEELKNLPALSCCGLEENRIKYDERIYNEIFKEMPSVKVIYLQGNDFVREFPNYRRMMVGGIRGLTYLDDRPVFPDERALSEAF